MPEARLGVETLATTNRIVIAGEVRGPDSVTFDHLDELDPRGRQGHRLRAGRASTGRTTTSPSTCTPSPPTSPRASTRPATRTRARATRASCSATPADETPELMPAPIYYAHKILKDLADARKAKAGRRRQARPRRQEPGHGALRERPPGRGDPDRALDPAPRRVPRFGRRARHRRALHPRGPAGGLGQRGHRLARQPDRQVRHRRPRRRCRPHRPQDHRRHLRRRGAPRRRRLLGQGPDQGRPLGGLCGALPRQERGRGRPRHAARRSSSPTPSASPSRCRSTSTCTAPARSTRPGSRAC